MNVRPSSLYGISDKFTAFCFDRAVTMFGAALREEVENVTKKIKKQDQAERKAQMTINRWLSSADKPGETTGRFRDPAVRML